MATLPEVKTGTPVNDPDFLFPFVEMALERSVVRGQGFDGMPSEKSGLTGLKLNNINQPDERIIIKIQSACYSIRYVRNADLSGNLFPVSDYEGGNLVVQDTFDPDDDKFLWELWELGRAIHGLGTESDGGPTRTSLTPPDSPNFNGWIFGSRTLFVDGAIINGTWTFDDLKASVPYTVWLHHAVDLNHPDWGLYEKRVNPIEDFDTVSAAKQNAISEYGNQTESESSNDFALTGMEITFHRFEDDDGNTQEEYGAQIERARFKGGRQVGVFRLSDFNGPSIPEQIQWLNDRGITTAKGHLFLFPVIPSSNFNFDSADDRAFNSYGTESGLVPQEWKIVNEEDVSLVDDSQGVPTYEWLPPDPPTDWPTTPTGSGLGTWRSINGVEINLGFSFPFEPHIPNEVVRFDVPNGFRYQGA